MHKHFLVSLLLPVLSTNSNSQPVVNLRLKEAIEIAQKSSLTYKVIKNKLQISNYNFSGYRASYLPKLSLDGTLPNYYRAINLITFPNGQNGFVGQDVANSTANIGIMQNIGFTGGKIYAVSSLTRLNNFGANKSSVYTSVPFSLSYFHDNIFYNDFKWRKKIEPLKLQEAQREFLENMEDISCNTVNRYFDLLLAMMQLKLDVQNVKNIDTLIKITQARFEIGTASLNEVLQAKVSLLNAKNSVANSKLWQQTVQQNLVQFLSIGNEYKPELELPDSLTFFDVSPAVAWEKAKNNRKFMIEYQRRKLEAEQGVAKTKASTGPSFNIKANLGLTQTGNTPGYSYSNLVRNQSLSIGFNIPLIDWGVNRSNRRMAEANLALVNDNIALEEIQAEQEINYQIMKWNMLKEQMELARQSKDYSGQRYEMAFQKYLLGSIPFTDFNNAQLEKDKAVTDYIKYLRDYWTLYYLIRRITLFDFENNKNITNINPGLN